MMAAQLRAPAAQVARSIGLIFSPLLLGPFMAAAPGTAAFDAPFWIAGVVKAAYDIAIWVGFRSVTRAAPAPPAAVAKAAANSGEQRPDGRGRFRVRAMRASRSVSRI